MKSAAGLNSLLAAGDIAVLIVLSLLSVWVVAIVIERYLVFKKLETLLTGEEESEVLVALKADLGALSIQTPGQYDHNFSVAWYELDHQLSKGLAVLGTLGNSAPFIGLFGTVLGVIKAFQDLSLVDTAGPNVVMAGISQALIATALGLLVAIPSAILFNYYSLRLRRLRTTVSNRLWRSGVAG